MRRYEYKHWSLVILIAIIVCVLAVVSPLLVGALFLLGILWIPMTICIRGLWYIIEDRNIE